jgi:hypothetical protein
MKSFNRYLEIIQEAKKSKIKLPFTNKNSRDTYTYYADGEEKKGDLLEIFRDISKNPYEKIRILSTDKDHFERFINSLPYESRELISFRDKINMNKIYNGATTLSDGKYVSYIEFELLPITSFKDVKKIKSYSIELGTHFNGERNKMNSKVFKPTIYELIETIKNHIKENPTSWIIEVNDEINDKNRFKEIFDEIKKFVTDDNKINHSVISKLKGNKAIFHYVKPNMTRGAKEESYDHFLNSIGPSNSIQGRRTNYEL